MNAIYAMLCKAKDELATFERKAIGKQKEDGTWITYPSTSESEEFQQLWGKYVNAYFQHYGYYPHEVG